MLSGIAQTQADIFLFAEAASCGLTAVFPALLRLWQMNGAMLFLRKKYGMSRAGVRALKKTS
ncbi:hypothetical protein DXA74_02625 [Bacteroides sp. OF04-15BH]|nr:hypothetical protein DXA74_02625 [Bacteroides sp. OF04-15BH]